MRAATTLAVLVLAAARAAAAPFDPFAALARGDARAARPVQPAAVGAFGASRYAIKSPVPNRLDFPVTIPPGGVLRTGFAVLPVAGAPPTGPVRFTVRVVPDGGAATTLVDRVVDVTDRAGDRRWHDFRLDLGRWAGTRVTLRLADEGTGGEVAWARPVVFDPAAEAALPSLLLITVDALRADHLGAYGYARPTSPHLDALARQGVRWAAAFTNAPMTVPSLPQLLTSRYFPGPRDPTLATLLFAGGVPRTKAIVRNVYLSLWFGFLAADAFDSFTAAGSAEFITRAALRWLDAGGHDRFALYLHYLDTHTPYRVPAAHARRFVDPAYAGPIDLAFRDPDGARAGRYDEADRRRIVDLYDGTIHYVDAQLGELFEGLEARGLLDRTLVIVTADHGEELWDHGGFFHGQSLYDELLHVPLIVRLPGGTAAGTVVESTVRAVDVVPTIAQVLGLPVMQGAVGTSLLDAAGAPLAGRDREVFAHAANPDQPQRFALRAEGHKLVASVEDGREELYDLVADPGERRDVVAEPAKADVLRRLRERLASYRSVLGRHGFQVRVAAADGRPHAVEVVVETPQGVWLSDPDRIDLGPGERVVLGRGGRTLTWTGTVGAAPAGIRFESSALPAAGDAGLTFRIVVDGAPLAPEAIRLAGGRHAPASPLASAAGAPNLVTDAPPAPVADGHPVAAAVWRWPEAGSGTSMRGLMGPDERRRLRALGYAE